MGAGEAAPEPQAEAEPEPEPEPPPAGEKSYTESGRGLRKRALLLLAPNDRRGVAASGCSTTAGLMRRDCGAGLLHEE